MSRNLWAEGFYEVPIQIGTYESEFIYSDCDGGVMGVLKRLRWYFLRRREIDFKASRNYDDGFWTGHIAELDKAIAKYRKTNRGLRFGVD